MLAPEHPLVRQRARRTRLRRRVVAGVLTGLVLVAGDGVAPEVVQDRELAAQVAAVLPGLQAFVEHERGLAFRRPVEVELVAEDEFVAALGGGRGRAADDDAGATLTGLGQLADGDDLDEQLADQRQDGIVGFYDDQSGYLVLRGRQLDAYARLVLVHELVHALQDQHGLLDAAPSEAADDERELAFAALVEGDATRVERAWWQAQPPAVRREIGDDSWVWSESSTGVLDLDAQGFPYYAGPVLVQGLLALGGQAALDAAYQDPPTSTAQVLHSGRPAGQQVEPPSTSAWVLDRGVLGELGLASLLDVDPLEDGPQAAWAGDRFVTVREGGATCTYDDVLTRDAAGRARLLTALDRWAGRQHDAQVRARGRRGLRLRSCTA